jgi:hypothetical protein
VFVGTGPAPDGPVVPLIEIRDHILRHFQAEPT